MNVNQIISLAIPKLLQQHQFLVIPNFGALILNYKSAQIKEVYGVIYPPGFWVSFNSNIKQSDGQFATYLSLELKCSLTEANTHLNDFANYCNAVLQNKARITIDGVGFFYYDLENNLCFEPKLTSQFNKESFGLSSIKIEALKEDEPIKLNLNVSETKIISINKPDEQKVNEKRWQKIATAAVIALAVFTLLGFAILNNPIKGGMLASFFVENSTPTYSPIQYSTLEIIASNTTNKDLVFNAGGFAEIDINETKLFVNNNTNQNTNHNSNLNTINQNYSQNKFYIVVGCFSQLENAKKLVNKFNKQGIELYLSGTNNKGMHVVSCGTYNSKNEALTDLSSIKSNFPNAWIKNPEN
jgi:hypothetical protein